MPDESKLNTLVRDVTLFRPGDEANIDPVTSYLGGTPFARPGSDDLVPRR